MSMHLTTTIQPYILIDKSIDIYEMFPEEEITSTGGEISLHPDKQIVVANIGNHSFSYDRWSQDEHLVELTPELIKEKKLQFMNDFVEQLTRLGLPEIYFGIVCNYH